MHKAVTIRIKPETRERLKKTGTSGDTFDSVINKGINCLIWQKAQLDSQLYTHEDHPNELQVAEEVLDDVDALIESIKGGDDVVSVENMEALNLIRVGMSTLVAHLRR
jgi:hypothetical protein